MKNLLNLEFPKIKVFLLLLFYFIFVIADIYTTKLATPDLQYEGNIIIRHFNLNWGQIIFLTIIAVLLISTGYIISLQKIKCFWKEIGKNQVVNYRDILNRKTLLFSFLGIWIFYSHFLCSVFLPFNNYFGYIFLLNQKKLTSGPVATYFRIKENFDPHFFTIVYLIFILISFYISWVIIIRPRYKDGNSNQI